jgi:hypothetical protein
MKRLLIRLLIGSAVALSGGAELVAAPKSGPDKTNLVDFRRDIRPILSDSCFHCHGPDESTRKAKMRLDTKEGAMAERKGRFPVVPGKPDDSEIFRRIFSNDPDEQMPPPDHPRQLNPNQKELIKKWIAQGANWQEHWAFQKAVRPELPKVKNRRWPRNEIDHFILARLEREGLKPSSEAEKTILLRRVTFDLTGLPPTPEEIEAFLKDKSANAYEKVVDRLLSSPRYGERMATDWLDASRYADTNGYQVDRERDMWRWRDWVIKAFNENKPFDQFTIEQLAGDLLPNATLEQKIASGFNRNHRINMEAGSIPEEFFVEQVIDRVDTTSTVWLGLTMGCARCHDHKYDPVTAKDFYSMYAFFNNVAEQGVDRNNVLRNNVVNTRPILKLPAPEVEKRLAEADKEIAAKKAELNALADKLTLGQRDWEQRVLTNAVPWEVLKPVSLETKSKTITLTEREDGIIDAAGKMAREEVYTLVANTGLTNLTGIRVEVFPLPGSTNHALGRSADGNFVLASIQVEISSKTEEKKVIEYGKATATTVRGGFRAEGAITRSPNDSNGWSAKSTNGESAILVVEPKLPVELPPGATLTIRLSQNAAGKAQIGRFRLSVTGDRHPAILTPALEEVLQVEATKRNGKDKKTARDYFLSYQSDHRNLSMELDALNDKRKAIEGEIPSAMVMQELEKPRETFILVRGAYDKKGERVYPNVPSILPSLPAAKETNRLAFAGWLVSPENPLTARVTMNRIWDSFFGMGIVKSVENFGVQGELPTHPELLDWMATEFMRSSWDLKAMQKLIVMSATYRQSSRVTPELVERDPENLLLARGPRFRLSAEMIRDQALFAAGLLSEKVGGPPVKPYQPEGLWEELAAGPVGTGFATYEQGRGEDLYRRSLYTYWKRTVPPPSMTTFDAGAREICTVKRSRTSTPLQALALLNDITYVEAARKLAERMITEGGTSADDRIRHGFLLATARKPKSEELKVLQRGLDARLTEFRNAGEASEKLLSVGESKRNAELNPAELAAYTTIAGIMLNLDEVVTKQ